MHTLLRKHTSCLILVLLSAATIFSYWGVRSCGFAYDDQGYITANPYIKHGLTIESVKWAFTSPYVSNWHPLTWISHMVDYQIWGLNPFGHHLTGVLLHLANTLLLFLLLSRMTGATWRSAFAAALFAVHPLHVESVAWVAERKDVLSTFFLFLTLWAYHSYTLSPRIGRYLPVAVLFALGLMAKPMLVTLPLLLLILDYWPLRRLRWMAVTEKIPLFVLSLGSCIVTFIAQWSGGAVGTLGSYPVLHRIENALVAYAGYVVKMVWPSKLAAFYPFPDSGPPMWQVIGSALFLACITAVAVGTRRKHPYLLAGWLWYIIALVPVIGLIQVGRQAMADRYTYVPLVGLFIMIAWAAKVRHHAVVSLASAGIIIALMLATRAQVPHWHDNLSLFRHAMAVTPDNAVVRGNIGTALLERGDIDGAIVHLSKALDMESDDHARRVNLGDAYARNGEWDKAIAQYRRVLRSVPTHQNALCNLGKAMEHQGESTEAMACYLRAIEADPNCAEAHNNLGGVLEDTGEIDKAVEHYSRAIEINPDHPDVHYNLGTALIRLEKPEEAAWHLREATRLRPGFASAHKNLTIALFLAGDYDGAREQARECRRRGIELHPDFLQALSKASER